ncbi:MAG: hypothetical protein R6T83_07605 [Salinibacter sp.]
MAQTIYGIIALALVSMLALSMHQGTTNTQQRHVLNEVATQVTGVGVEVFEHIGRGGVAFDKFVVDTQTTFPTCGRTTTADVFTPEDSFAPAESYATSTYIEGFDGMTEVAIDRDDIPFEVDIEVAYVDPVTLAPSAVPTFAKEVTLTISSPFLFIKTPQTPVEVQMQRVFEYDTVTKDPYIPYSGTGQCPTL